MDNAKPWWAPDARGFVAGAVIIIAAAALFYRMTHASTVDDKVLDMMLTIMYGTALVAIINFLFGSSRSSSDKDATINAIAASATPAAAGPAPVAPTVATAAPAAPAAPPSAPPAQ